MLDIIQFKQYLWNKLKLPPYTYYTARIHDPKPVLTQMTYISVMALQNLVYMSRDHGESSLATPSLLPSSLDSVVVISPETSFISFIA